MSVKSREAQCLEDSNERKRKMNTYTMRREPLERVGEIVGCILVGLLAVVLFWLYLFITPDQNSAEFDAAQEESRHAEMNGEG
jgi:hypothetical protein